MPKNSAAKKKMETKIIVTLGPATRTEGAIRKVHALGADFVRVNMSHSSVSDLEYFITTAKKIGAAFIVDTEGSQIRTGNLVESSVLLKEGETITLCADEFLGDEKRLSLRPREVFSQLQVGDILYLDFDTAVLRIIDVREAHSGHVAAEVLVSGFLGQNKGVVIDPVIPRSFNLPALSHKDYQSIEIGIREGARYIAASFMRSGAFVDEVRRATRGTMRIISKIECQDGLDNLDDIILKSDYLLIDRGDLSKEVSIERIPFLQKIIIEKARVKNKGVFVATNLLETMVEKKKPTRAEIHDIESTVLDGAQGLALAAETAIGKYPFDAINTIRKIAAHAESVARELPPRNTLLADILEKRKYLAEATARTSSLVAPHGGKLVNRFLGENINIALLRSLPRVTLTDEQYMDAEQIAAGTFSPIEGFMGRRDHDSVLDSFRLSNGILWPLPIVLDVTKECAAGLKVGRDAALVDGAGDVAGIIHVEDLYTFDKKTVAEKLYGTSDETHPGVRAIYGMNPVFVGGTIDLVKRRAAPYKQYEMTPRQTRRLFEERGWSKIVGFHTRNVIHRGHEFIQLRALEETHCDGLFVHPVIGKKKAGDFETAPIIKSYELMMRNFYPKDKVVFATYATFSRYAGPREALFTALCRKNFGCSHFIIGRDHTGVGDFYHPKASHEIFDRFPDVGIIPLRFDRVFYSEKTKGYIHERDDVLGHAESEKLHISGTQARRILLKGESLPEWFMRPEIAHMIKKDLREGERVFVKEYSEGKEILETASKGIVLWLTGLSGSGKTTIADALKEKYEAKGKKVCIIDGDAIRNADATPLGFSRENISENNRRIAFLAKIERGKHDLILIPVIAPFAEDRKVSREIIGKDFFEIFVDCSLGVCVDRDVKGLYKEALSGRREKLIGMEGSSVPYEAPISPDLIIKTEATSLEKSTARITEFLEIHLRKDEGR